MKHFLRCLIAIFLATSPALADGIQNPTLPVQLSPAMFDLAGNSRTTLTNVGGTPGQGTNAQSWFVNANALAGQRYVLGIQNGGSGCRTDQFLAGPIIAPMLSSQAGWLVIDGFLNDLAAQTGNGLQASNSCSNAGGAFPFTNNFGETVTQTNVGQLAAQHIINAALSALAIGKKVVIISEPGSALLSTASVGQMYDGNARLLAFARQNPGNVVYVDFNHLVWDPIASSTLVGFVGTTACASDGVHPTALCGALAAPAFNLAMSTPIPFTDTLIASINDNQTTNPRQLIANALFTNLTGGTTAGCGTITGNIPSGWAVNCGLASTNITITSAASTWCSGVGRCGNDITLAITCAGAGVINFQSSAPSTALWNLTDIFQFSISASVAAGSSNFAVYANASVNTSGGGNNFYGNYAGVGAVYGPGPTTAYAMTLTTPTNQGAGSVLTTGTKSFVLGQAIVYCSAAGSGTVTFSRASFNRVLQYRNGAFSG